MFLVITKNFKLGNLNLEFSYFLKTNGVKEKKIILWGFNKKFNFLRDLQKKSN